MLDTGASTSLVTPEVIERIPYDHRPELAPVPSYMLRAANGEALRVYGTMELELLLDDRTIQHTFHVADMNIEAILGVDFMAAYHIVIDVLGRKVDMVAHVSGKWGAK